MSGRPAGGIGRALVIGLLMVATLGFGLAGLCGAAFTVIGATGLFNPGPENYASMILFIAIPSLLLGGGLAVWCVVLLARRFNETE